MLGTKPWNIPFGVGIVVGEAKEANTYRIAWVYNGDILRRVEHRECFTEVSGGHIHGKALEAA